MEKKVYVDQAEEEYKSDVLRIWKWMSEEEEEEDQRVQEAVIRLRIGLALNEQRQSTITPVLLRVIREGEKKRMIAILSILEPIVENLISDHVNGKEIIHFLLRTLEEMKPARGTNLIRDLVWKIFHFLCLCLLVQNKEGGKSCKAYFEEFYQMETFNLDTVDINRTIGRFKFYYPKMNQLLLFEHLWSSPFPIDMPPLSDFRIIEGDEEDLLMLEKWIYSLKLQGLKNPRILLAYFNKILSLVQDRKDLSRISYDHLMEMIIQISYEFPRESVSIVFQHMIDSWIIPNKNNTIYRRRRISCLHYICAWWLIAPSRNVLLRHLRSDTLKDDVYVQEALCKLQYRFNLQI